MHPCQNLKKNTSITSLVPHTKRALETFVFKIRAIFIKLNKDDLFELGNLKHKNLDGSKIVVRDSNDEEEVYEQEEEEEVENASND